MLSNIASQIVQELDDKNKNTITSAKVGDNFYSLQFFPSTQENNRADYLYVLKISGIIEDNSDDIPEKQYFSARKFFKAYKYFSDRLEVLDVDGLKEFYKKINSILLINITVDSGSDAFRLFDTLNNRGILLSAIDIIKNKMLSVVSDDGNKESLKNAYNKWKKLADNIDGVETRFLRQYYNAFKYSDNVIKFGGESRATQSNLIKIYEKIIDKDAKYLFKDLYEKSKIYEKFHDEDSINKNDEIEREILEFKFINTTPTYTILMYLLSLNKDKFLSDYNFTFLSIVKFLQKFAIRRNLTNLPATKALDGINMNTIEKCKDECSNGNEITLDLIKSCFINSKDVATD